MPSVRFFTRTVRGNKKDLVPLYVRLKHGRDIDMVCRSGILIRADHWSNETNQLRRIADPNHFKSGNNTDEQQGRKILKEKVEGLESVIWKELTSVLPDNIKEQSKGTLPDNRKKKKDVSIWLRNVIDRHWHPEKYEENLFTFIQGFIDKSTTRINPKTNQPVCYKMRREYEVTFDYLKRHSAKDGKKIDFKDINMEFYEGFIKFLQEEGLAVNTIGKKIQTLKIFLNAAKEEGKNQFEGFRGKRFVAMTEESENIYLDEQELAKIYELDLSKRKSLDQVRDLFLVGCWTGCRFSDISQITPESISGGFINIRQFKTGKKVVIPLHPVVTAILNKYSGILPKAISNQKFNDALKIIACEAKINEQTQKSITKGGLKVNTAKAKSEFVTTHSARRSFATNLYKSGFPSLSIMAITGHGTEKSFLKYIKVTPDEHARKLQEHWGNQHLKVVSSNAV